MSHEGYDIEDAVILNKASEYIYSTQTGKEQKKILTPGVVLLYKKGVSRSRFWPLLCFAQMDVSAQDTFSRDQRKRTTQTPPQSSGGLLLL